MPLFVSALAAAICLQSCEHRTVKTSLFCPAGEMYPNGEFWLDPVRALGCIGENRKRRRFRLQLPQLRPDRTKLRIREPRRHPPDIPQLTLLVSQANQQRPEKRARTARFGPAADDGCMDHANSKFKMQNSNSTRVRHTGRSCGDVHSDDANT